MSKYCNIPIEAMRDFLKIEKGWVERVQNQEIVFDRPLNKYPFIVVKVYTGIRKGDGQSRGCGQDAIRVCAVNINTNAGWIKSARVYRVEGWRDNLKERVLEVIQQAKERVLNHLAKYPQALPRVAAAQMPKDNPGSRYSYPINHQAESEALEIESLHE